MIYLSSSTGVDEGDEGGGCDGGTTSTAMASEAIKSTLMVVEVRILLNWLSTKKRSKRIKRSDLIQGITKFLQRQLLF